MKMLGVVVGIALLTSGCVTGYQWSGPAEDREEPVGRFLTLERCQQDSRTTRCERSVRTSGVISPSIFLPGGQLSNP